MSSSWEEQKQTIRGYWIDQHRTLKEVMEIMKENHDFDRSKKAYENRFARWGPDFKRKRDASLWAVVGSKVQKRDKLNKKSSVTIKGELIPKGKLYKEISRHHFPSHEEKYGQAPSPKTPPGVSIFTPSPLPDLSCISIGLPWLRFQNELMAIINSNPIFGAVDTNTKNDSSIGLTSSALANIPNLLPEPTQMRALLPVSFIDTQGPELSENSTSVLYRFSVVMYLISNNMLDVSENLFGLLEVALARRPFLSLLHMKTPTTRAFVRTMFGSAVKFQRASVISMMLDSGLIIDAWNTRSDIPLRLAIEGRDTALAKRLVEAGANISGTFGSTALICAVINADIDLVPYLVDRGVDPNARGARADDYALIVAARRNDIEMVVLLLELGADINKSFSSIEYDNPLVGAARRGDLELVGLLLNHGMHAEDRVRRQPTALTIAISNGHAKLIRILLDARAAVYPPSKSLVDKARDSNALYEAATENHTSVVKLLLHRRADPNARVMQNPRGLIGETVLHAAVRKNNARIVQLLLRAGALVNDTSLVLDHSKYWVEETALHRALRGSHTDIVEMLLDAGAILDSSYWTGTLYEYPKNGRFLSAMELATRCPDSGMIRLLLTVDPRATIEYGVYFLRSVARSNDVKLAQYLLNAGVDVNCWLGGTALQQAVMSNKVGMIRFLLHSGADINAPAAESNGRTALQSASENGNLEILQILLKFGAAINAPGSTEGGTALHLAAQAGYVEVVRILLNNHAAINSPGSVKGGTALQLAAQAGHVEIVQILLESGAAIDAPDSDDGRAVLQLVAQADEIRVIKELLRVVEMSEPPSQQLGKNTELDATLNDWRNALLPLAARFGLFHDVESLLTQRADVNFVLSDSVLGTALHEASARLDVDMVELLLSYHANPNIFGPIGEPGEGWIGTPLQIAVEAESMKLIQLLTKHGARADVLAANHDRYRTPLETAIREPYRTDLQIQLVREALKAGADVNLATSYEPSVSEFLADTEYLDELAETALATAVLQGNTQLVKFLLQAEANVNASCILDGCGTHITPLQVAVASSDLEISKLLLAEGADVRLDFPFEYKSQARDETFAGCLLAMAILEDNLELFQLLLASGAKTDLPPLLSGSDYTALQAATLKGYTDQVKMILERGADVDAIGYNDETALMIAARRGYVGIASTLLEAGANPVLGAPEMWSVLSRAAAEGRIDMVQLLLNAMKARDLSGQAYIEILESELEGAEDLQRNPNIATEMIRAEIESARNG